jgi:thiol:disulfide interchange protein DsbD
MQACTGIHCHAMKAIPTLLAGAFLAGTLQAAPVQSDEPLQPDQAFRPGARLVAGEPSARGAERHGIDVEYRIAPGYYLYRDRLRFSLSPATLLTGPPEFPPGVEIDDQFLGKSVIYRDRVAIHIPFLVSMAKPGRYKVRITAQGCAENRLCYAPFPQEVVVNVPPGYRVTDGAAPGLRKQSP